MTKNSSLLAKSKTDKSLFSGQTIPDTYQSLDGLNNPKAYASSDRSGLAGGIPPTPPLQTTTTSTTTTTTTVA
jgi:hypothetical protein